MIARRTTFNSYLFVFIIVPILYPFFVLFSPLTSKTLLSKSMVQLMREADALKVIAYISSSSKFFLHAFYQRNLKSQLSVFSCCDNIVIYVEFILHALNISILFLILGASVGEQRECTGRESRPAREQHVQQC